MTHSLREADYYNVDETRKEVDVATSRNYTRHATPDPDRIDPTDSLGTGTTTGRHKIASSTGGEARVAYMNERTWKTSIPLGVIKTT